MSFAETCLHCSTPRMYRCVGTLLSDDPLLSPFSWFIVTYGLGIYLLNNFIGFLSPQVSPSVQAIYYITPWSFYSNLGASPHLQD